MRSRITSLLFPRFINAQKAFLSSTPSRAPTPRRPCRKWTPAEDEILVSRIQTLVYPDGRPRYSKIAEFLPGRSKDSVRSRWTKTLDPKVKSGSWTKEEDEMLTNLVQTSVEKVGRPQWAEMAKSFNGRTPDSLRTRWVNTLNPEIRRGDWTKAEDELLTKLALKIVDDEGYPYYTEIARHFPGRTAGRVRERWLFTIDPAIKGGPWTKAEDSLLVKLAQVKVDHKGRPQWTEIEKSFEGRTPGALRNRYERSLNCKVKLGRWTKEENEHLKKLIRIKVDVNGRPLWTEIGKDLGGRTGSSVQERWEKKLDPNIKRGQWSKSEDLYLTELVETEVNDYGRPLWSQIAKVLGRSQHDVLNRWIRSLNPKIKHGSWTKEEDELLKKLVRTKVDVNGRPLWSEIGKDLGGRTGPSVLQRWKVLSSKNEQR